MALRNIIEIENLTRTFEGKIALSSLSFTVQPGEKIAVIGPSGAGKTTLLHVITGILYADNGLILIDGQPLQYWKNNKQLANKIGVIRQQFDLVGNLPVVDNVLAGRLKDWSLLKSLFSLIIPQEKNIALGALKRVGMAEHLNKRTSLLSGGEQQRVALARLLVQKPVIILADEPVSSLDPARAVDILKMLTELADEQKQTLIATIHSVHYAKKYFDRLIALKNGQLFFDLPTSEVTNTLLAELYELKGELEND